MKKFEKSKRVNEHPWATTEASDGSRPPRSAAASGRLLVFAGSGLEAMALGVSWMSWRHPAARHWQQRRGYSGRTSERSRHVVVGRVTFEVQRDETLGLRRSRLFSKRRRRSTLC